MTLGQRIKELRESHRMFQKDLAYRLHVSKQTISSWETDRTEPNMANVKDMAEIFHCNVSDIVGEIQTFDYSVRLETDEMILIEQYRKCDTSKRLERLMKCIEILKGKED